ncbi:MAG TPA: hypothetical protein EYG73_00265 [Arcobacter sp.]|nr:hypothetical protein [Arcobacter sp.]
MIIIEGKIIEGESAASGIKMNWNGYGSIYHQFNYLKKKHPSFTEKFNNFEMATINVKLEKSLSICYWKYTFEKVFWLPHSDSWYEKLSFLPIKFIFNGEYIDALLYKAYKSPHKNNNFLLEIIAPHIKNLAYNQICNIQIKREYIE